MDNVICFCLAEPLAGVRNDWRERTKLIRPVLADEQANLNGIRYRDVAAVLWDRGFTLLAMYDMFYYFDRGPDGYGDALFVRKDRTPPTGGE